MSDPHKKTYRDRGSGYISKQARKDGRYEGRVRNGDGSRAVFYGKTRKAVQDQIFAHNRKPRPQPHSADEVAEDLTVGEWLDRWLVLVKSNPKNRLATYKLYKNSVERHIKPIHSIRLSQLTKANIYDMLDGVKTKSKKGIGNRTRQVAYTTLYLALQVAFKRDKVARNVAALVDKPTAVPKKAVFLSSDDEIRRFRQAAIGSRYEALYLTALDTGLRQGELLALKWVGGVDLPRGYIDVKNTLTTNEAGELEATPPKTEASVRRVRLLSQTVDVLKAHKKQQMSSERGLSDWVFPNADGGPTWKDGYLRSEFKRVVKKAGVPKLTFHGLRHSHATLLAGLGVNIKATQERLGHSTTRITQDIYSHLTTTMQDQVVTALDSYYKKAGRKNVRQNVRQPQEPQISDDQQKTRNALRDAG